MKNLIFTLAILLSLLTSCNNKKDSHGHDHSDGTHKHEDGMQHEHQDETSEDQVEFDAATGEAVSDTISVKTHDHSEESDHQH